MARPTLLKNSVLAEKLKKEGWSYQALADKMNDLAHEIGKVDVTVRPSNISAWIKGSDISGSYLALLLSVLKMDIKEFYPLEAQSK